MSLLTCWRSETSQIADEMRRDLEDRRQGGLTDKNVAFIRQVLSPGVWGRVLKLPIAMMAEARRQQHAPVRAAVMAQLAVAIAILSVAPLRLANLTAIRLGTNLIKPGGPGSDYWLTFPDHDVKNRVKIDYPLKEDVTRQQFRRPAQLIDAVVDRHGSHPGGELRDVVLNIGQGDLGRRIQVLREPTASPQESQECSVSVGKVVAAYRSEIACGAARLETSAGPAGVFPGPPIGIRPFVNWQRPR